MSNTFHILALCGFGDILSHITRLPAVKEAWPGYEVKFWLGGFGKSPQFSKEQLEREGYEASIIKNFTFHNQLPQMREFISNNVLKPEDKFEDWSFCEEIFSNIEPVFMHHEMKLPYEYADTVEDTFLKSRDMSKVVVVHPLTKSGNAEGFEHDMKAGRFWDRDKWKEVCEKLIVDGYIPTFTGYGDEDWGLFEELGADVCGDMRIPVNETVHVLKKCAGCIACNSWDWEISARAGIPTVAFYTKNHFFLPIHLPQGPREFWDNCYVETDNRASVDDIYAKFKYMMDNKKRPDVDYSVCMVTMDDEDVVKRTMDNVEPYVNNDFVVIDGGSEDKTVDIVKSSNCNVKYAFKQWIDDFAQQKNTALADAACEWRVWIDADETYEHIFWNQLPWYIWDAERNGVDCIYVPRINTLTGLTDEELQRYVQEQGWQLSGLKWINYPDPQQRVFKSNCKFVGRSHERIVGAKSERMLVGQHILHPKTKNRQQRGLTRERNLYEKEAMVVYNRIMEGE